MNNLQFFTTLQIGWLNAWIPAFAMVLVQFVYMAIYKESGKRAVDTSWYTAKDKMSGGISSLLQILLLLRILSSLEKSGTASKPTANLTWRTRRKRQGICCFSKMN